MMPSHGLSRRVLAALIAFAVIGCLVPSVLGYVAVARLPGVLLASAPPPAPATHVQLSSVRAMLEANAFECDQGYSSPVGVWYCYADRAHDTSAVGIQVAGRSEVGVLTAHVAPSAQNEPDPRSYATYLLGGIAAALVDRRSAGRVRTWIGDNIGSTRSTSRQFGSTWMTLDLVDQGGPVYLLLADVDGASKRSVAPPVLSGARVMDVEGYFQGRGWSCESVAAASIGCMQLSSAMAYGANIVADPGGVAVKSFNATVASATGDPRAAAEDLFTGAIGLVLRGDDAARAIAWLHADLDGLPHEHAVSGVHIVILPQPAFSSLSQGGELELSIDPVSW